MNIDNFELPDISIDHVYERKFFKKLRNKRTTLSLPQPMYSYLEQMADKVGITVPVLVGQILDLYLIEMDKKGLLKKD